MQLKTTTDYAIRAVICLAANGNSMCSTDIAEKMGIPPKYLINIMVTLRETGIIASRKGAEGGYYLNRDPRELTLWDVIKAMESTVLINRCMESDRLCSHDVVDSCLTRQTYVKAQQALEECLNIPVANIVED
ncbi:MAG: Rrf2 family transcriptional regulator [Firmicutes bacterium]|nr:Rrf2 family transcriptional regulator [Bacillota bacterium]